MQLSLTVDTAATDSGWHCGTQWSGASWSSPSWTEWLMLGHEPVPGFCGAASCWPVQHQFGGAGGGL